MEHHLYGGVGGLSVSVSPIGGRIIQINGPDSHAWLVPASQAEPRSNSPIEFVEGARGGWDECLPSIEPMTDPNAGDPREIADHGDFWFRPWQLETKSDRELILDSAAIEHPLRMRKLVRAVRGRPILELEYTVTNRGWLSYQWLYSAHPLWSLPAGARLDVSDAGRVVRGFGFDEEVGSWPMLGSRKLSEVVPTESPKSSKFFVEWAGMARLTFSDGHSLVLRQSPEITPWLGVCVNRGCWPPEAPGPDWVALEPTTSPTDSLRSAIDGGCVRNLPPGETVSWTTTVEFSA